MLSLLILLNSVAFASDAIVLKEQQQVLGIKILGSKDVSPTAYQEVARLTEQMLSAQPAFLKQMLKSKIQIAVLGKNELVMNIPAYHSGILGNNQDFWNQRARGFGATKAIPLSSAPEENLLCYEKDTYTGESIFIHEFAHSIHELAIIENNPSLALKIESAYALAMEEGLWKNTYAATNFKEYLAEGAQSWFGANIKSDKPEGDGIHNQINTREALKEYDLRLASILKEIFGDTEWRYSCPTR